jgi:hypothetical protein
MRLLEGSTIRKSKKGREDFTEANRGSQSHIEVLTIRSNVVTGWIGSGNKRTNLKSHVG